MLAITKSTGCECKITKSVVMNRLSANQLGDSQVSIYPNPALGNFNVSLAETFGSKLIIKLINANGSIVKLIDI